MDRKDIENLVVLAETAFSNRKPRDGQVVEIIMKRKCPNCRNKKFLSKETVVVCSNCGSQQLHNSVAKMESYWRIILGEGMIFPKDIVALAKADRSWVDQPFSLNIIRQVFESLKREFPGECPEIAELLMELRTLGYDSLSLTRNVIPSLQRPDKTTQEQLQNILRSAGFGEKEISQTMTAIQPEKTGFTTSVPLPFPDR